MLGACRRFLGTSTCVLTEMSCGTRFWNDFGSLSESQNERFAAEGLQKSRL